MDVIEIIAVIFAVAILVKMVLVLVVKPDWVMRMIEKVFPRKGMVSVLLLVMAAVIGYFLLGQLTLAQIGAAALFGMLLYGLILVQYPQEYLKLAKEVLKDKKKAWLPWAIFILFALWILADVYVYALA